MRIRKIPVSRLVALVCAVAPLASGAEYLLPEEMFSPGGVLGVRVPVDREVDGDASNAPDAPELRRNAVVEVASGRVVAVLAGDPPAYDRPRNHHGTGEARWSADGGLLLWRVDGKWSPDALEVVRIDDEGRAAWQVDLLRAAQRALLVRTREAAPEAYAAAKRENAGNGRAFPDGFTIDVTTSADVALPLAVRAELTANPKGIEDYPANLDSHLDAVVTRDGRFVVKRFSLGAR